MKKELGIIRSANGRSFEAYWLSNKKEVYVRPHRASLQNTPTRLGYAYDEEEAYQLLDGFSQDYVSTWA